VKVNFPAGAWMRAIEVRPSNPAIVHHLNVMAGNVPTMVKSADGTVDIAPPLEEEIGVDPGAALNPAGGGEDFNGDGLLGAYGALEFGPVEYYAVL
jgi:hypothetical protein